MYVAPVTVPGMAMSFQAPAFEPGRYSVTCVPARDSDGHIQNWTLKQLGDERFRSLLRETLPDDRCTYYAPTVDAMSGVVLPHTVFNIIYDLDDTRRICRPGYIESAQKRKSDARVPCDGTSVGESQGLILSTAGCKTVVLNGIGGNGEDVCLASHAGRNSLIDRHFLRTGRASRTPSSIIEAMVLYAKKRFNAKPEHLILRSFFSLPYQAFPHDVHDPIHGLINQSLHRYLKDRGLDQALVEHDGLRCLSLNAIISMQAMRLGVGHVDAGLLDLPVNGSFAYTTHADPQLRDPVRNLVYLRRY